MDENNASCFVTSMIYLVGAFGMLMFSGAMLFMVIHYNDLQDNAYSASVLVLFLFFLVFLGAARFYYRKLLFVPPHVLAKLTGWKQQAVANYMAANPDKPITYGDLRLAIKRAAYDKKREHSYTAMAERQTTLCALRKAQEDQLKNNGVPS